MIYRDIILLGAFRFAIKTLAEFDLMIEVFGSRVKVLIQDRSLTRSFKADLDGTILSHATCLRQAYDTNCVV